jgi:hypothetical protein
MAIKTTLEQIEEVQAAITLAMSGQEYKVGNVSRKRADLKALEARERYLLNKYYREPGARRTVAAANFANAGYRPSGGIDDRVC